MEISSSRLAMLFRRYYSGLTTEAETDELMHLIRESEDDEALSELIKNAWENLHPDEKEFSEEESRKMLQAILLATGRKETDDEPETKVYSFGWGWYAAASMLIFGGFLYWLIQKPVKSPEMAETARQMIDIPPGGNRAVLTLSDGTQIVLDSLKNGLLVKHGVAEITKTGDGKLSVSVAKGLQKAERQFNTLSTPKGGQYQITLEDGSNVWLNASSSIRFPTTFSDKSRVVEISGEAYFEVAKEKNRAFNVRFRTSEVEVLGTHFNIMAYSDERASKTTLVEGSVRLRNGNDSRKLKPGQQGSVLSSGLIETASVDTDREIAWKNGIFYFKESGIEEVMRQAARWYNIEVRYEGKIQRREFTGKVSRNVHISELLNLLRYAGVNCKIKDKKVVVKM